MLCCWLLKNCCGYAQCGMVRWFEQWIFRVNIVKFWVFSFHRFPVLHFFFHILSIHLRTGITVVVLSESVTEYEKTSYLLLLEKVAMPNSSRRERWSLFTSGQLVCSQAGTENWEHAAAVANCYSSEHVPVSPPRCLQHTTTSHKLSWSHLQHLASEMQDAAHHCVAADIVSRSVHNGNT